MKTLALNFLSSYVDFVGTSKFFSIDIHDYKERKGLELNEILFKKRSISSLVYFALIIRLTKLL